MKLWIDDERDPQKYLGENHGVFWEKEAWAARRFLFDNEDKIEVLYLDNYLGDHYITGQSIFELLYGCIMWGDEFEKLKTIYLHSSDLTIINTIMSAYAKELKTEKNVDVLIAPYRDSQ